MQLDPTQFVHHLDSFDMSQEQKIEYVRAIIVIMQSFVDRAFGDAPEQILLGTSQMRGINRAVDSLDSKDTTPQFNDAANGKAAE